MQRGMITFSGAECEQASHCLIQIGGVPADTIQRFAPNGQPEISIELSEEDAERLLDSLPMPKRDEPPVITSVRQKTQQFLSRLRQ